MPDVTTSYKIKMAARKYPLLQRPLKKTHDFFTRSVPTKLVDLLRVLAPVGVPRIGPPKNSFSVFQSTAAQNCRPSRVVLTDQGAPAVGPESLMVVSGLSQHNSQPWPIFWSHHPNARLVGSTLAWMNKDKWLCREAVYGDVALVDDPAWRYAFLPKPVFLPGNWTSIVSRWCQNTGAAPFSHWIMDALPRLALLSEFPPDTKILVPRALAGYQKEMLKMLGLLDRVRCSPEKHIVVENYYFSSPTSMISCYSPYAIKWLRATFLPHADKSYNGPRRFVIERKGKTRGIKNEAEVNDYFQKLGWALIDTEKLTFAQELQLFSNAEAIAGIFGSGFTNAIWSPPGCKVITFVADDFVDGGVESHCVVNNINYFWRIFPSDHAQMAMIDLAEVKKLLRKAGLEAG